MDPRQGTCPSCAHSFRVPASFTADKVRCPQCKAAVELSPASPAREGSSAKRPARARAGAAHAGAEPAAAPAGSGDARPHHRHRRHHAPPKTSRMPFVIGGVALVGLLAAVAAFTGGDSQAVQATAPAVVTKPDFSALPDLERAEGTSDEAWAEMNDYMTKYITPPFGKASEKYGDLMMHRGKPAVPAILNAYKRLDFTTQEGADIGWKMQTLLLQGLTGVNYGWSRATRAEEVASNTKVVERWFAAWNKAKLDDAAWAQLAQEAGQPAAN